MSGRPVTPWTFVWMAVLGVVSFVVLEVLVRAS